MLSSLQSLCVFLELSCFCHDPAIVGNLNSASSAFSKTSLNIWKSTVHILLKPGLENFEHYFASMWNECNCAGVWIFFGIAFLWGFPWSSAGKESTCNAGDLVSIPGLGRYTGEGKGYPLQCSGLQNSMDCIVYGVTKSQTQLSDFHSPLWDWNKNWPFPVPWPLLSFPNLLAYWMQPFHCIIF